MRPCSSITTTGCTSRASSSPFVGWSDLDPRSVSLARLLTELALHPETMTRGRHVELWEVSKESVDIRDKWRLEEANKAFDRYAGW